MTAGEGGARSRRGPWTVAAVWAVCGFDSRKDIPLPTYADPATAGVSAPVVAGLREATVQVCGGRVSCVEAYRGVILLRFGSKDDARRHATALRGEGFRSNWIVVHYTDPAVSNDERFYLEQWINGTWSEDY